MRNAMDSDSSYADLNMSSMDVPGQTHSSLSPNGRITNDLNSKLIIVMVGLPARGKSYLTKKLLKYFNWLQYECKIFNVGNTRRQLAEDNSQEHDATFFDPANKSNAVKREEWALDTLNQMLTWLVKGDGSIGIFDATNTTKTRRNKIVAIIRKRTPQIKILFLESICTNRVLIEKNIKLKLSGPDYKNMDPIIALNDFKNRLLNYEKVYQTIDEDDEDLEIQYIKIVNVGKKVISYNISGYLASQTVFYLLNFNLSDRQIWLTRHGETFNDISSNMKLGNSDENIHSTKLTPLGAKFSKALPRFMNFNRKEFRLNQLNRSYVENMPAPSEPGFSVWTSMYSRAVETASSFQDLPFNVKHLRMLNELNYGKFENLNLSTFREKHPKEYQHQQKDRLGYRYPGSGGESYLDVISRLTPIITELERCSNHLLLITHKVITRILLSYFMNWDKSLITDIKIPLHCVYCLTPKPYGVDLEMYQYDENMDWFFKVPEDRILRKGSMSIEKPRFFIGKNESTYTEDPFSESSEESDSDDGDNTIIQVKKQQAENITFSLNSSMANSIISPRNELSPMTTSSSEKRKDETKFQFDEELMGRLRMVVSGFDN